MLLEAGLLKEAAEALSAGADGIEGDGHDQLRAEFDLELARAHRLMGRLESSAAEAAAASRVYADLGATAWQAKATLVGLLTDLDTERRDRDRRGTSGKVRAGDSGEGTGPRLALAAAATADDLVETATQLGDAELADAARVVAAQALLLAGDVDAARTRLLSLERVSTGSLSDELDSAAVSAAVLVEAGDWRRPSACFPAPRGGSLPVRRAAPASTSGPPVPSTGSASPPSTSTSRCPGAARRCSRRSSGGAARPTGSRRSAGAADDELATLTESLRSVRGPAARRGRRRGASASCTSSAARLERQIRDRDWALSSGSRAPGAVPVRVREARELLVSADRDLVWLFAHRGRLCGVGRRRWTGGAP